MFILPREQRVCQIGPFSVGGQPGENPPLLISSMFHNGDRLLESRRQHKFDRVKAREYVRRQEELSGETGVPALVAMVASSTEEMKYYIDFFTSISAMPFGIDIWVQKTRLEAMAYVKEQGLLDRVLFNSITPWDKDLEGEVETLKELGVQHVVVQVFDQADQSPAGRLQSFRNLMRVVEKGGFRSILVDTAVMNLPAIGFSCLAARLIKEESGWPAGVAASNGTWMWKEAREKWGSAGFGGVDAAGQAIAAVLWSDFLFCGPIVAIPRIMPAVVSASLIASTLAFHETGRITANQAHPLHRYFGEFAAQLAAPGA